MNTSDIASIEGQLNLNLPAKLREFFLAVDRLPERLFQEGDLVKSPQGIIELNRRLRATGYYHLPWLDHFLAVGSDPGDCIYYFDLSSPSSPVFFADHDFDDVADYKRLAETPDDFVIYLHQMLRDWEKQDADGEKMRKLKDF
jgi:hypothetical protein